MKRAPYYMIVLILATASIITACGGGGDSVGTGKLSLNITDAPVDEADHVFVAFSGLTIKPANGPAFDIDFVDANNNPVIKSIDLLSLQGANSLNILDGYTLDAGRYNWIRLHVISSEDETDTSFINYSYIEIQGIPYHLYVPSGDQTGLKLNRGFTIEEGQEATFTIDFDLRKSIVDPGNPSTAYKLKPTLRIVENQNAGHIIGTVGNNLIDDCTNNNYLDYKEYAVYAYSGAGVTPDDTDGVDPDPVSSSMLSYNSTTDTYHYGLGFLQAGNHTLSFTCQASEDKTDEDNLIDFNGTKTVNVVAGQTITEDIN